MAIHIVLNRNQEEGIPRGFEPWQAILDAPFKTNVRAKKKTPVPHRSRGRDANLRVRLSVITTRCKRPGSLTVPFAI